MEDPIDIFTALLAKQIIDLEHANFFIFVL